MSDNETTERIPFEKLGVSAKLEPQLARDSLRSIRVAIARGLMPLPPVEQLGAFYVLATDPDEGVRGNAIDSIRALPAKQVVDHLSVKTHPKILEMLATFREPDPELDERLGMLRTSNDRTVMLIAARAGPKLCEMLARNHERLLVTPDVFVALHANEHCADRHLQAALSFLRMQRQLPEVPEIRPFLAGGDEFIGEDGSGAEPETDAAGGDAASHAQSSAVSSGGVDLMAEIEAAMRGEQSPTLLRQQEENIKLFDLDAIDEAAPSDDLFGEFDFDFTDEADAFSWNLTDDISGKTGDERSEIMMSLEQKIREFTVGAKIKLAYMGNKEARGILIRDTNKIVASAVVKSGRLSEQEVATFAGNKNLDGEIIRELAANREFTRKYPVKVALVNNPKTPVSLAVSMVPSIQKKDLIALTRNRNIPSVVSQAAVRLVRQKYRK